MKGKKRNLVSGNLIVKNVEEFERKLPSSSTVITTSYEDIENIYYEGMDIEELNRFLKNPLIVPLDILEISSKEWKEKYGSLFSNYGVIYVRLPGDSFCSIDEYPVSLLDSLVTDIEKLILSCPLKIKKYKVQTLLKRSEFHNSSTNSEQKNEVYGRAKVESEIGIINRIINSKMDGKFQVKTVNKDEVSLKKEMLKEENYDAFSMFIIDDEEELDRKRKEFEDAVLRFKKRWSTFFPKKLLLIPDKLQNLSKSVPGTGFKAAYSFKEIFESIIRIDNLSEFDFDVDIGLNVNISGKKNTNDQKKEYGMKLLVTLGVSRNILVNFFSNIKKYAKSYIHVEVYSLKEKDESVILGSKK